MKERPSAIWHMVFWGIGSGFLLALFYIVIFVDLVLENEVNFSLLFSPSSWYLSAIFGAVPNGLMGFFLGLNLRSALATVPHPFTDVEMNERGFGIYSWIFAMTLFFSFVLIFFFFGRPIANFFGSLDIMLLAIPPFAAAAIATFAAHRYMFRLRLWSILHEAP